MARERYLVGVKPEELEYKPIAQPPVTPQGWFANFWYHHKWVTLGILFGVIVLTVLSVQALTQVKPDYQICMAVEDYVPEALLDMVEEKLSAYGEDLNGDGKVVVSIQYLNVSMGKDDSLNATSNGHQSVVLHIAARDIMIFAFSPEYYELLMTNMPADDDFEFFAKINAENEMLAEDGRSFGWDLATLVGEEYKDYVPKTMVVGVRSFEDVSSDDLKTKAEQAKQLLEAYLSDQPAA